MQTKIREKTSTKQSWSVIHPLSPEDSAAMITLRSAVAAMKGKLEGVAARAAFDGIMEHVASPDGVAFGQIRSEAYPAGGPKRGGLGRALRSSICMVAGSTGERLKHSVTSWATSD